MDTNIDELAEEFNQKQLAENTKEQDEEREPYDPELPPGLQATMSAVRAAAASINDKNKANYEKEYFGECAPQTAKVGAVSFQSGCGNEGLYFHEELMCKFFAYVGGGRSASTGEEGQAIRYEDKRGVERELFVPLRIIAQGGQYLASFLSERGFFVSAHKGARDRLQHILNGLGGRHVKHVDRPGWIGDELVFALPGRIIGHATKTRVVADLSSAANLKVGTKGTLEGSRELLGLCKGNSRLQLALSTSVASCLLRFIPHIMPTCVHVFGESSIGKSTTNHVAGMIWGGLDGDPQGFGHSWNGTLNFHLKNAASHSGMIYMLDELRAGANVTQVAYALAAGQDRGRLDKSANQIKGAKTQVFSWSNGEVNLDEMERIGSSKASAFNGAEFRLPSIPADTGSGLGAFDTIHGQESAAAFADTIQTLAREHYGHIGPLFVEQLIEHVTSIGRAKFTAQLNSQVSDFVDTLKLPSKADDAVRRLAKTFGLIAAAGALACQWGVFPLRSADVIEGVRKCFLDWLASRGGSQSRTTNTALVALRDFIGSNQGRFAPAKKGEHVRAINLAGYHEEGLCGGTYYLLPSAWKEVLALAPRAKLASELDHLDLLVRQPSGKGNRTDQYVKKFANGVTARTYAISGQILELRDDGTFDGLEPADNDRVVDLNARRAIKKLSGKEVA